MEYQNKKYYCDDSVKKNDNEKWNYLLNYSFQIADAVEFNLLFRNQKLPNEIQSLFVDLIEKKKDTNKIYFSGESLKFRLTDRIKDFIKSKKYSDWKNYYLEDISFIKGTTEFFATITHENYIILQMTQSQRSELNQNGFNFWCEWDSVSEE
jgi:hypothetical protein